MVAYQRLKHYEAELRRWKKGLRPEPTLQEFGLTCCGLPQMAAKIKDQIEREHVDVVLNRAKEKV